MSDNDNAKSFTLKLSGIWSIGWLFTIGFAKLGFWSGTLAVLVWPYYLGGATLAATH